MQTPPISTFDFNLLRVLHVLLRERNVTRAARTLNVTQQAMSGSLKRLRQQFDDPILVRVGQRLEATPMGLALVEPVREAMRQIALTLEATPAFAPETTQRCFRIAMSDYVVAILLPPLIADLSRVAPGLTFEVVPSGRQAVYDLETGTIDFIVMPKQHVDQVDFSRQVSSLPLFSDRFVCVVDAENRDIPARLSLDDYRNLQHVALKVADGSRSIVQDCWVRLGLSPRVLLEVSSFVGMICVVQGTPLIATVHERLAARFARTMPFRVCDCPLPDLATHQELRWHTRSDGDPAHRFVRDAFLSASRALP